MQTSDKIRTLEEELLNLNEQLHTIKEQISQDSARIGSLEDNFPTLRTAIEDLQKELKIKSKQMTPISNPKRKDEKKNSTSSEKNMEQTDSPFIYKETIDKATVTFLTCFFNYLLFSVNPAIANQASVQNEVIKCITIAFGNGVIYQLYTSIPSIEDEKRNKKD